MVTDVGRPHLRLLKRALRASPNGKSEGAIHGAVRALADQYQAGDVSLPIHRGDEAEMELKMANPAIIGSGTPATVCYVMGESLEPEAENKVHRMSRDEALHGSRGRHLVRRHGILGGWCA